MPSVSLYAPSQVGPKRLIKCTPIVFDCQLQNNYAVLIPEIYNEKKVPLYIRTKIGVFGPPMAKIFLKIFPSTVIHTEWTCGYSVLRRPLFGQAPEY